MDYGAITIDTSIFKQYQFKFDGDWLKKLEYFRESNYPLLLSEIVIKETLAQIEEQVEQSKKSLLSGINKHSKTLFLDHTVVDKAKTLLVKEVDDGDFVKKKLNAFMQSVGAETILASGRIDIDRLINMYFEIQPPFGNTKEKRKEFPDAMTLMSLEAWAIENKKKILAVSTDHDWAAFAKTSTHIDVIEDLVEAISIFQPPSLTSNSLSQSLAKLPDKKPKDLYDSISESLSTQIENHLLYPEATSAYYYEVSSASLYLKEFNFVTDSEGKALISVIEGSDIEWAVGITLIITVDASAFFEFSVKDWIDKDMVRIGSADVTKEVTFESSAILEINVGENLEDLELENLLLSFSPLEIDFGEIEPDQGDEYQ